MRHAFTDEQLQLTILDASDQRSIFIRTARELEDIDSSAIQSLRTLLYHLPEPEHDPTLLQGYRSFTRLRHHPIFKGEYKKAGDLTDLLMDRLDRFDRLEASKGSQHQADDWQQCRFEDIQKGDRVRWVVPDSEDKASYEIIVRHLSEEPRLLYSNTGSYHFPDGVILYRIQAPVTPPDPAECPVIIVHKELAYDFTQTPDGGQAMMWNGDTYENADYEFFCKDIIDWTLAKVTPLED